MQLSALDAAGSHHLPAIVALVITAVIVVVYAAAAAAAAADDDGIHYADWNWIGRAVSFGWVIGADEH